MPYPFIKVEPDTIGSISKWDIPINEWMGLKFGSGSTDSLFEAVQRRTEDYIYGSKNLMKPEVANEIYGIPGYLQFSEPVDIQQARLKNERKKAELKNMALLESADHSWMSGKALAGFGAMLAGNLANPLDLGLAFVPIIGSEKMAVGAAKMGAGSFKQRLARGLLATEEKLAAKGVPLPRLTGAIIDGTINQAITEIPVAIQKHRDDAIYGMADSLLNIAAGGLFSGAVKGLGLALEKAGKRWLELDPRIKEAEMREIATQLINGESPRGGGYVEIDESIIRAKAEAIVGTLESRKTLRKQAVEEFEKTMPQARVETLPKIEGEVGKIVEVEGVSYRITEQTDTGTKAQPLTPEQATVAKNAIADPEIERLAQKSADGKALSAEESDLLAQALTPDERKVFSERVQELTGAKNIEKTVDEQRKVAIQQFIEKKKADYQQKLKDQIDVETKAEIQAQLSKGKTMAPEQIKRYSFTTKDTESFTKALEEDVNEIKQSIKNDALTEEEQIDLQAELDAELGRIEDEPISAEQAIPEGLPCIINKASK